MKNVVIIGAGPAGLTAAYELLRGNSDYEVTILEASDRIGGISQTVRSGGNRMDIGGHRFFSKDERVVRWWDEIMPLQGAPAFDDKILNRKKALHPGGPDPEKTDRVFLLRDRISRIYYQNRFYDYPITLKWETIRNMGFLTTMRAGFSYLYSMVRKLPETSLENFYINRFGKVLYSMFFESYTEKVWGRHPRDISADWGAQRVKGLSIVAILKDILRKMFPSKKGKEVETSLIESFYYPKYGPGHLWETVAEEVKKMGGAIRMGCEVVAIQTAGNAVRSVSYRENGKTVDLETDVCISSMPIKDLIAGWRGDVPAQVREISQDLPYRDFVTVGLLVPRLNLENRTQYKTLNDIVPDCWIYVQDASVRLGRIQIFNNWSPYMVEKPAETVWIGLEYFCQENDAFWNLPDGECIAFAQGELEKLRVIEKGSVLSSHIERVKKAYPAYFGSYDRLDQVVSFLNGFENLYCVGRNGQHRYNNMDHSMATAFESVENIRGNIAGKGNVWSVNTEQAYHEKK